MESTNTVTRILDEKLDKYGNNLDDFVAEDELTVTITISEYRKLVSEFATKQSDIKKAEADKYERNRANDLLKADIEKLKAENYELKKQIDELKNGGEEDGGK